MKLLLLLPQFPLPTDQGAKLRNLGLLRILSAEHELHVLCFADEVPDTDHLGQLGELCRSIRVVSAPRRSLAARLARLVSGGLPDLAYRRWSRTYLEVLQGLLVADRFDAVHASNLEMAGYLRYVLGPKRVLDDHNAEYLVQRRAHEAAARVSALSVEALYSRLQWRRLERFEAWACRLADLVLAVSDEDARALTRLDPGIRPVVVPNGLDLDQYPVLPPASDSRPFLLFSGKLDYRPNADALRWFCDAVLPLVWRERPQARLLAVGAAPPAWLVERGKRDPRVVVTGYVPDDRPYLQRCAVYVLPMRWGGGVRYKALVALASGRPLVSTSMGAEGLGCVSGRHALVADEPADFAAAVVRVLDEPDLAASLAGAGRALVERRFAWPSLAPTLLAAYRGLSAKTGSRSSALSPQPSVVSPDSGQRPV